jgi:hypothetical protein
MVSTRVAQAKGKPRRREQRIQDQPELFESNNRISVGRMGAAHRQQGFSPEQRHSRRKGPEGERARRSSQRESGQNQWPKTRS